MSSSMIEYRSILIEPPLELILETIRVPQIAIFMTSLDIRLIDRLAICIGYQLFERKISVFKTWIRRRSTSVMK